MSWKLPELTDYLDVTTDGPDPSKAWESCFTAGETQEDCCGVLLGTPGGSPGSASLVQTAQTLLLLAPTFPIGSSVTQLSHQARLLPHDGCERHSTHKLPAILHTQMSFKK